MANKVKFQALFESLASLSVPLERVFHIAIAEIKSDESISEEYREELLGSVKALLFNSLEIHNYVGKKDPSFDIMAEGVIEYAKIRDAYKNAFPSERDENINLHEHIEKRSSRQSDR